MKKNNVIKIFLVFAVLVLSGLLFACQENKENSNKKKASLPTTITVDAQPVVTSLYYKGVLKPIAATPVVSPIEGYVNGLFFRYGESVKKNKKLLSIRATELANSYRQTVSDYLQKKASLETQTSTFEGDKELYHAGVISKQDFDNARNSYATAVLNLNQARIALEKILSRANISFEKIEKLKLEEVKQVSTILQRTFSNYLVRSPAAGIMLIPTSTKGEAGQAKDSAVIVGTQVKKQQPILLIGDPTGYKVLLQVSELKVVDIKPGLKAIVTGDAFPGVTLTGFVKEVSVQANPAESGNTGVSLFNVVVDVPHVSMSQRKAIRIGMNAKVEIQITHPNQILVPMTAVFYQGGKATVRVINPKTKQQKDVPVVTGQTTVDKVTILQGLSAGEVVVTNPKGKAHAKAD